MGSNTKLKTKVKFAIGRANTSMDSFKSNAKKLQEDEGNGGVKNRKYERKSFNKEKLSGKRSSLEVKHSLRNDTFKNRNVKVKLAIGRANTSMDSFKSNGEKLQDDEGNGGAKNRKYERKSLNKEKLSGKRPSLEFKHSLRNDIIKDRNVAKGKVVLSSKELLAMKGRQHEAEDSIKGKRSMRKPTQLRFSAGGKTAADGRYRDEVKLSSREVSSLPGGRPKNALNEKDTKIENQHLTYSAKSKEISDGKVRLNSKTTEKGISTLSNQITGEVDVLAKSGKRKLNSSKHGPMDALSKRGARSKKFENDESKAEEVKPKKRKRVIRIDPRDISNKRLDDTVTTEEKVVKDCTEISKNAEFRAIQPNPSILSFVEDNLLGRRRLIELRRAGYNVNISAPLDNIPFSTNPERERIEENVFRNNLTFFAAAKISSSFPPADLPEIAFAGRSNVGKSSLLNALTRQWGVVRTSDKPGLTQTINFFKLASKLCLVDLPGYGFAYAKEEVKEAWQELVKEYVSTRVGLKRVCVLIDTQWGMKPRDFELIDLMERSRTKYQIVLTKTDLVFPIDVARRAMQLEERLKSNKSIVNPVMMVSSKSGAGIRCLRNVVAKLARLAK
ncbi:uncharacterized protein [Aristolochia californica]|uniref:uncharacterized protein n=1 Tax=Aristolochia californica TaxID=171875 RepID=UPI0035D61535